MSTALVFALALALAWPLGRYMARLYRFEPTLLDRVFGPLERLLYRLARVSETSSTSWQRYAISLLVFNLVLGVLAFLVFVGQGLLPMNPHDLPGLDWDLALHTAASFVTNTNQQHYSGQAQLSYFSQTFAVVTLQFLTPASGLAALIATLRGLFHSSEGKTRVGHFLVDTTRTVTRVFVPLVFASTLLLASQGVPATLEGPRTVELLTPSDTATTQTIPVGPVAPMVAIKQLGTNGGGWYGPNSAVPLENPTPLSNLVQMVSIPLIPMACVFCLLHFGRRRFGLMTFGVMAAFSVLLTFSAVSIEQAPNAAFADLMAGPNWEGKELRLGVESSAAWASLTTQTSNGSVNAMHDSLNPLGGVVTMVGMFINATWGGIGVGLMNFLLFVLLTVFIAGLMVGRTPEVFGRKLAIGDVKLISLALILQPLLVLVPSALALSVPDLAGTSNPGFHGVSQVVYEYASAVANNGSGFEGLADNTPWWNVTTTVCLVLARFIPIIVPLAVAARIGSRRVSPEGVGSLRIDSAVFGITTLAVIVVFALLSFLPVLALGPIGEHLTLTPGVLP